MGGSSSPKGLAVAASLIDQVALSVVLSVVNFVVFAALSSPEMQVAAFAIYALLSMILGLGYTTFFHGWRGQTPGKMALSVRVVNADGTPLTYGRALLRSLAAMVSSLTLGIGYILAGTDAEKRALHDMMVNTRVVFVR